MSDIKIQPSATGSGTVTITAPTTNTARVITLPDSTETLVGVDQNGNLGIAITPETDWTVYNSIQIGGTAAFAGNDGTAVMGENWKFAGGNKYIKASEASRYYTNNGNHVFQTAPSGSADADITWTTALEALNTGRVRATNGIMFGSDTAAANALDDYEEGTWTPTAIGGLSGLTATDCHYRKIGSLVHIAGRVNAFTGINTATLQFGGLPFNPTHSTSSGTVSTTFVDLDQGYQLWMALSHDWDRIYIRYQMNNAQYNSLTGSDISSSSNIHFNATYIVD